MARESSPSLREMQHDVICDGLRFAIAISRDRTLRELRRDGVGTKRHRNGLLGRVLLVDASDFISAGRDVARAA